MSAMSFQITDVSIVYLTIYSSAEYIKAPRHWPLWGESNVDRRIPLPKASNARKCIPFDVIMYQLVPLSHTICHLTPVPLPEMQTI